MVFSVFYIQNILNFLKKILQNRNMFHDTGMKLTLYFWDRSLLLILATYLSCQFFDPH